MSQLGHLRNRTRGSPSRERIFSKEPDSKGFLPVRFQNGQRMKPTGSDGDMRRLLNLKFGLGKREFRRSSAFWGPR
ncbi:unnamed protein product, partial [Nesidiocoris tenuis]